MSRTKKDSPRRVLLRNAAALPGVERYERHSHPDFGRGIYHLVYVRDEAGEIVRDDKGSCATEYILYGRFADFCTVDVPEGGLPAGVHPPCRRQIIWRHRGQTQWEAASRRERLGHSRREARDSLRRTAVEYNSGEDLDHDYMPLAPTQREVR